MTENHQTEAAKHYHNGTKHPYGFLMDYRHRFAPHLRPMLFKKYQGVASIEINLDSNPQDTPTLEAIAIPSIPAKGSQIPNLSTLTRLLYFSAGITKRIEYPGLGAMYFRAAACTGALYHIELYLACGDLPDLEAGLYHFDPSDMRLDILRQGDYRRTLVDAAAEHPGLANAPVILIYTDVFWRNACKYQAREYRHTFWDSGTILSHTLALAASHDLPHHLCMGFVDETVNRLLDLDTEREVTLGLLGIGHDSAGIPGNAPDIKPLDLKTVPISETEIDFPPIREMHQASSLKSPQAVADWRADPPLPVASPAHDADLIPLQSLPDGEIPTDSLEKVTRRRGSSRQFSQDPLPFEQVSTLLERSNQGIPADYLGSPHATLNQLYLIIHAVDGLEPGAYVYHRDGHALERLRAGNFRRESYHLALDQALGGNCAAALYFLTDLEDVLEHLGNRGYRAAQIDASITAGKMYLAAYAQDFGATGLTFYDDAVIDFFSPHAEGKQVMFLIAVGVPGKRK